MRYTTTRLAPRDLRTATAALLLILTLPVVSVAQSGSIAGLITDSQTGDPLPGANIRIDGTAIGTSANLEGAYRIRGISAGASTFVVTYVGYESVTFTVSITAGETVTRNVSLGLLAGIDHLLRFDIDGNPLTASMTPTNASDKLRDNRPIWNRRRQTHRTCPLRRSD